MTNILIAADSFKGSATSQEIGNYIQTGIQRLAPNVSTTILPVADGGEGTLASLLKQGGTLETATVTGPLGKSVTENYGRLDNKTAIIEVAQVLGLPLVGPIKKPFQATSFGLGELIKLVLKQDVQRIYIALGGSAINDAGLGMLQALGGHFTDKYGQEVGPGLTGLQQLAQIDLSQLDPRLQQITITGLSDVTNPLTGKNGATFVYGRQKGLTREQLPQCDQLVANFAKLASRATNTQKQAIPGAGAAGGLGFALLTFTHATLRSGAQEILRLLDFKTAASTADLVITGEGRMDGQSQNGKLPLIVSQIAKEFQKPVIAIVGSRAFDLKQPTTIDLIISTVIEPQSLEKTIAQTKSLVTLAGENAWRAFNLK
ncbi:hypothetical protein BSQ39_00835 [Loigolactobacillus backii]|uniref:glycerate kinase family protein n=1 Tax=Loigolactobacillus backii TaxID=375175 RepID=UPI000C1C8EFE|nr:glycerate kinase [Loigolactobacillus backii]PIO82205.1 hypothetical protein BSQ39_00835 [Loigolactobacillus backii]